MTNKLSYCTNSPNCSIYNSFIKLLGEINSKSKNTEISSIDASGTINGVVIEYSQSNKLKERKFKEYSCLALERLFYYPSKEISDFGEYDFGKEKIKKYYRLKIINRGVDYEFNCERIDKLNSNPILYKQK